MPTQEDARGALANDAAGNKLFPTERQARIVEMLATQPKILAADLAREFDVSSFTVRADLAALEAKGLLKRCYGGAIPVGKMPEAPLYGQSSVYMAEEKRNIGKKAAEYVQNNDCILVDTGTTTIELVKALDPALTLSIVTNDIAIADYVESALPHVTVMLLGGFMRHGFRYTSGPMVLEQLARLNADKVFLSANGFTPEQGFMSEDTDQAMIKSEFLKRAGTSFMLMDETKFGSRALFTFATGNDVDYLITNEKPMKDYADALGRFKGMRLIVSG